MGTIIRKMKQSDMAKVRDIIDTEIGGRIKLSDEDILNNIDSFWVADYSDNVVGVVSIQPQTQPTCGYDIEKYDCIKVIAVTLGFHKIGIGGLLLEEALKQHKTSKGIMAEAWDLEGGGIPRAGRILRKLGFESATQIQRYYTETPESQCPRFGSEGRHCDRCTMSLFIRPSKEMMKEQKKCS